MPDRPSERTPDRPAPSTATRRVFLRVGTKADILRTTGALRDAVPTPHTIMAVTRARLMRQAVVHQKRFSVPRSTPK